MGEPDTPLTFIVRRHEPELVVPAKPTPRELKLLSDIDDQESLRFHVPTIWFYSSDPKMINKNPASVIREALANVLVFYYPFAGRLREGPARKLMVDCSGEGVLFIEAEADVTLKQFGSSLQPPIPCLEELLFNVRGSDDVLHSPLLLIQVTRLLCGGFIFAIRFNHCMCDAQGFMQFLIALSEIARDASTPSTLPVWQRELLMARDPPRVTYTHHEYDQVDGAIISLDDMVQKSFFFGPTQLSAIRRFLPIELQSHTTFEVLTAFLWRCRTIALNPHPEEKIRVVCVVNARKKFNHPLPIGYYGNVLASPVAISTAQDLCNKPLAHALELIVKAKSVVNEEYVRSVSDLMVIKGRPPLTTVQTLLVSDVRYADVEAIDLGWGKAIYATPTEGGVGFTPGVVTFYFPTPRNANQADFGIVIPICLPSEVMYRFVNEVNNMFSHEQALLEHKQAALSKL